MYFIPPSLCSATQLTNGPELAQTRKATTRKSRAVLIELYLFLELQYLNEHIVTDSTRMRCHVLHVRFVEELHAFDQNDLEESILSEMETRLHTRAVFALPSLQQQQEAAASAPTRSPETRSAKRAPTQREPSPAPAADEPKLEAAADAQQSAAPGIAEPTGESSAEQKPAPESSENPAPPAAAV